MSLFCVMSTKSSAEHKHAFDGIGCRIALFILFTLIRFSIQCLFYTYIIENIYEHTEEM